MAIELPKDAEGREIPLDTKVLYDSDGIEFFTDKSMYMRITDEWWFFGHLGSLTSTHWIAATRLHLTSPDSWEKLEDDLNRVVENNDAFYEASCAYMNQSGAVCNGCRLHGRHTRNCTEEMFKDVVSRIRKLKGED